MPRENKQLGEPSSYGTVFLKELAMVSLKLGDGWLLQDLANFVEPVQVTDSDGKVLGLFMPANPEQGKELNEKLDSETDWAEIERRAQCTEAGRTTEEVLANLKS